MEISAKSVEEAIEIGLSELNTSRDQVEIEILREGKRGVFGLGAEDALVRITLKQESEAQVPIETKELDDLPVRRSATPPDQPDSEVPSLDDTSSPASTAEKLAIEYLSGLLERMGIKAEVTARIADDLVELDETPPLVLDVTGSDLGILIGRRSETLRALQYMVRLMVSKEMSHWTPIVIDVESYRVRRRNSLRQLAEKMADRAAKSQRKVVMESMPAYERRIIHITLRNHPDVITKSVGSDDNRKVTIIPK